LLGSSTRGTAGRRLRPKIQETTSSLLLQTIGEPYTPHPDKAPPLQSKGEGPPT
jgi:hypothetical protein